MATSGKGSSTRPNNFRPEVFVFGTLPLLVLINKSKSFLLALHSRGVQLLIYKYLFLIENVVFSGLLIISLIYRKNRKLNPIRFYLAESAVGIITTLFISQGEHGRRIYDMSGNLFSFLDLTVLYYYFRSLTESRILRRFLMGSYAIITGICIYFWMSQEYGITTFIPLLYGLENLFITIPCLLFIYELFKSEEEIDLKTNPHFYIACAFLFFYGATFPFYITYKTLYAETPAIAVVLSSVQIVLIIIMYVTIMKAFLCPYPEQK